MPADSASRASNSPACGLQESAPPVTTTMECGPRVEFRSRMAATIDWASGDSAAPPTCSQGAFGDSGLVGAQGDHQLGVSRLRQLPLRRRSPESRPGSAGRTISARIA
jgi:hypothetical protein